MDENAEEYFAVLHVERRRSKLRKGGIFACRVWIYYFVSNKIELNEMLNCISWRGLESRGREEVVFIETSL